MKTKGSDPLYFVKILILRFISGSDADTKARNLVAKLLPKVSPILQQLVVLLN